MKIVAFFTIAFLPIVAIANGEQQNSTPAGMKLAYTTRNLTITHYSATPQGGKPCKYECYGKGSKKKCVGGVDKSPSGVRPLSATIDKGGGTIKGKSNVVLAAVPQRGGNSSMYGCFFTLPGAYGSQLFYGGDAYGPDSNGKYKIDVSSQCTPRINQTKKSIAHVYDCPGARRSKGNKLKRKAGAQRSAMAAQKSGRTRSK